MNKKNLSVVMAGAMLATSVAPVLAETTAEVDATQIALLKNSVKEMMKSGQVSTNNALKAKIMDGQSSANEVAGTALVTKDVADQMVQDSSKYGIRIVDKDGKAVDPDGGSSTYTDGINYKYDSTTLDAYFDKLEALGDGYTLEVYERATSDFYGEIIPGTAPAVATKADTYQAADLSGDGLNAVKYMIGINTASDDTPVYASKLVDTPATGISADLSKSTITVNTNKLSDSTDSKSEKEKVTLSIGQAKIDGRLAVDKDGKLIDVTDAADIQKFDHFLEGAKVWTPSQKIDDQTIDNNNVKKVSSYTIKGDAKNSEVLTIADLTDGVSLTAKGTSLATELKEAAIKAGKKDGTAVNSSEKGTYPALVQIDNATTDSAMSTLGVVTFNINYYANKNDAKAGTNPVKTITVVDYATSKTKLEALRTLLADGTYKVGVIGGTNRYETAVNVDKAQEPGRELKVDGSSSTNENNIVLVNGTSLVDGLAAAPYAAKANQINTLSGDTGSSKAAPVLLSKADSLPKETKDYMNEITKNLSFVNKEKVTVTLVGGESVLTENLEKEIKDMGFTVKRLGGDNREETSLAVARAMADNTNTNDAFVVGANGEADAMSIAAVAAKDGSETPIIVSSVHGLTKDAVNYIKEKSAEATNSVTIVGGEAVVSKEEAEKLDEVVESGTVRIAGANRYETNAKIIATYKTATAAVVVKDGARDKSELVDSLSAANYAAQNGAPIVLATSEVKDVQKNALLKATGTVNKLVQIGEGVNKTVLETIAKLLNVSNI